MKKFKNLLIMGISILLIPNVALAKEIKNIKDSSYTIYDPEYKCTGIENITFSNVSDNGKIIVHSAADDYYYWKYGDNCTKLNDNQILSDVYNRHGSINYYLYQDQENDGAEYGKIYRYSNLYLDQYSGNLPLGPFYIHPSSTEIDNEETYYTVDSDIVFHEVDNPLSTKVVEDNYLILADFEKDIRNKELMVQLQPTEISNYLEFLESFAEEQNMDAYFIRPFYYCDKLYLNLIVVDDNSNYHSRVIDAGGNVVEVLEDTEIIAWQNYIVASVRNDEENTVKVFGKNFTLITTYNLENELSDEYTYSSNNILYIIEEDNLHVIISNDLLEGNNQKFDSKHMKFRLSGLLDDVVELKVNGEKIDSSNYSLASGSTIIELNDTYLNKLTTGNYKLTVIYNNGSEPYVDFSVPVASEKNPQTVDNIMQYFIFSILALLGILIIKKNILSTSK